MNPSPCSLISIPRSPISRLMFFRSILFRSWGLRRCENLVYSQDNVFVHLQCSIQYRIIEESADDAFFELQNPEEQIQAYVFDVVRAHVPRMTLDELFEQKGDVLKAVLEELEKVMGAYGYNIEQILMVDMIPDPSARKAMNEINAAGRCWCASGGLRELISCIATTSVAIGVEGIFMENWALAALFGKFARLEGDGREVCSLLTTGAQARCIF